MGDLDLIGRLTKFCDEWAKMRHTVDEIQGLHHGEERGCVLRASDIRQAADEIARLREALGMAKDLLDCIFQTPDNVWYVSADDPETAVCGTYSKVIAALQHKEPQG